MKIFISWAGDLSKAVAEALADWLPEVIQAVKPWVSAVDIDKGKRWLDEINIQLEEGRFGIACLDRTNLKSEWIHWEMGALAAKAKDTSIWTYLIDVDNADVQFPLAQFQHTKATQEDTLKLLQAINSQLEQAVKLSDKKLQSAFARAWPEFSNKLESIKNKTKTQKQQPPSRPDRELLEEILDLTRRNAIRGTARSPLEILENRERIRQSNELRHLALHAKLATVIIPFGPDWQRLKPDDKPNPKIAISLLLENGRRILELCRKFSVAFPSVNMMLSFVNEMIGLSSTEMTDYTAFWEAGQKLVAGLLIGLNELETEIAERQFIPPLG